MGIHPPDKTSLVSSWIHADYPKVYSLGQSSCEISKLKSFGSMLWNTDFRMNILISISG